MILITGGAGFIGSNLVHYCIQNTSQSIINVDKLCYAGNLQNLASIYRHPRHVFERADIGDTQVISQLLAKYRPRSVVNLAAQTHVDRSIHDPDSFIETNVMGTLQLLKSVRDYWSELPSEDKTHFRFLHVSTDEVYGSLDSEGLPFRETSRYAPNSPYAASKAASDHLVRSFHHSYGLPVLTTNCSNNYGPYQFPEKLIPLSVLRALNGDAIPIYGDGQNIRDWLHVTDHCAAIKCVLERGRCGETYNIGGRSERANLDVVRRICTILDREKPSSDGRSYSEQVTFVKDRPGHDWRYAVDNAKTEKELGWKPRETFESGLHKTVCWYLQNQEWVGNVVNGTYRDWIALQYRDRAGAA